MKRFSIKRVLILLGIFLSMPTVAFALSESVFYNPLVLNGILVLGFLLFLVGLLVPGFSFVEILSVICFCIYFKVSIDMGVATLYSVMFFVVGIGLIVLEVFVPGFGLIGISGFILTALGILTSSVSPEAAIFSVFTIMYTSVIFILAIVKLGMGSTRLDRFMLQKSIKNEGRDESLEKGKISVGDVGIASTNLRPTGYADINGSRWDVTGYSNFIGKGKSVEVVSIVGNKIVVKEIT